MWSCPSSLNSCTTKWEKNIENKCYGQLLIMKPSIDDNKQYADKKMKRHDS